jgi:hypothetical protein
MSVEAERTVATAPLISDRRGDVMVEPEAAAKPELLIIDELGYLPFEPNAATCASSWSVAATSAAAC